uniref:DCD domain-containing protein n=1 Tax=Cajanus cajan TaxID=3821 RepID=A0A151SVV7_CAJCA|nr:hypothetical protein KK1_014352 [Cajanus cajan]
MILFLFEYEKRQLHGVFKASCDGAINIVPNAFAAVGKQYPAQVKFDIIWSCKPIPEKLFRDAIRENYFSANKFNFGLSENQRLSFMQDIKKQEKGNHARNEEYDFHTSVNDVMERVRQNHIKWINKRKPKPKHNKAESLRDKTQISGSRKEGDCFEDALTDKIVDLSTTTGGNTNKTAEDKCFVDFKRRSKVRKLGDESETKISKQSEKSENLVLVQQKRRKLVRPNFSKSITSDDKGIDLGASKNFHVPSSLGGYNVKESCCTKVQTEDIIKADAEIRNIISPTHFDDKNSSQSREYACSEGGERATDNALAAFDDKSECLDSIKADAEVPNIICRTHSEDKNGHARGYFCGKGGEKATDGALTAFNDESKCLENINPIVSSCKDKNYHLNKGLYTMDSIKSVPLNIESSRSICQEHHVHNKIIRAGRGINADEEMPKDCGSSFTIEAKEGSEYLQNSGTEKAPIETCPMIESSHVMDSIKSVSAGTDALHSICQKQHLTGKIIFTGRGSNTKEEMSKDSGSSLAVVKDGVDCLQNSNDDNASIATSYFKEGLCMADNKKSVFPDSESLRSICQECDVDKACAGSTIIKTEGLSKDGTPPFTTGVKDGSYGSQKSGNDNAPVTT